MKSAKKMIYAVVLMALFAGAGSCKKETTEGPNDLGGDTNIQLTQVGNVSSTYMTFGGASLPQGTMTVTHNDGGIVTYHLYIDLTGRPDSAALSALVPASYKDGNGHVVTDFKFKITSEGIQDYFNHERPWTVVKYADAVGTVYPYTSNNGTHQERTVTEKTGLDDWPMGMLYIKTSKVEEVMPANDKTASKITFRANHKFGLVYVEVQLKNGQTATINIIPWFML